MFLTALLLHISHTKTTNHFKVLYPGRSITTEPPWVTVLYILDHPININRWLSNATPLKLNDRGLDDPKLGFDTDYI